MTKDPTPPPMPWDLVRTFLALHRHGDYAVAAELEGIDDSTLRRRIHALERHVGRSIFVRTVQGWRASPDLHELLSAAMRMEAAALSFARIHPQAKGVVRISVLDALAQHFADAFAAFGRAHPGLVLNVTTESHFVDLEREQVDIAIRLARPLRRGGSLRIRKLGDIEFNAYAGRTYAQLPGEAHRLLSMNLEFAHADHNFSFSGMRWEDFGLQGGVVATSDSFLLLCRLCQLGLGVTVIPTLLARRCADIAPVDARRPGVPSELWMVSRLDLRAAWQRELAESLRQALREV